jgi:tetrathionate reductase subunit A
MSDQWDGTKFTGGSKAYWQGDTASADFVIFVGASPFEGNYGPTNRVPRITERLASGDEIRRDRPASFQDWRQGVEVATQ